MSSPYYPWHSLTVHGVCENKLGLAAHTPIYKLKGLNQSPYIVHVICRCKTTIILPLRLQTLYSCILPIIYGVTNINCKRTEVIWTLESFSSANECVVDSWNKLPAHYFVEAETVNCFKRPIRQMFESGHLKRQPLQPDIIKVDDASAFLMMGYQITI